MAEFFPQTKITDPDKLFGRESDLHILADLAESLGQVQIIGARRFGKTSIALCLETLLRNDKESRIYPIYTDVKTARIKGTANFYRYLISVLVARLCQDKQFRSKRKFGMLSIKPYPEYIIVYNDLLSCPDELMVDTFKKLSSYYAEVLQKTILVLFDEFEYLAMSTFDNLDGFMPLREYSADYLDSGIRPFSFWLIGARPWGQFVEKNRLSNVNVIGGSGEFNNVEIEHPLSPISKDAFLDFWKTRCEDYYGIPVNEIIREEKDYIVSQGRKTYDSVSGVPFYGSSVAKYIKAHKSFPDYTVIKSHIAEAMSLFDKPTLSFMRSLCSPRDVEQNDDYHVLDNYGLIRVLDDGKCTVAMEFLRDYLVCKYPATDNGQKEPLPSTNKESILDKLVDSIDDLIDLINENCKNKNRRRIFDPSGEDRKIRSVLKRVCSNEEEFGQFLEKLAKYYYERTKASDPIKKSNVPGQRLAELEDDGSHKYKSRTFFSVLEPLRTYYAAHLRDKVDRKNNYQLEKGQALEKLQGHNNEPETPEEWFNLQKSMLHLFEKELRIINQKVKALS